MAILDLAFIRHALALPADDYNAAVGRVVIDSRDVRAGDVFVAIQGDRVDGHDFIAEVLEKGAIACIASRADCAGQAGCLMVDDTVQALGRLAQAWRQVVNPQLMLFGITGSAGKTTVKEMLTAILRQYAGDEAVLATAGNFNNHIGLPLTLLRLKSHHRYAVIEMGMNHFGELAYLTGLAKPDFALVNNALRAHVGCGFDGVADIARAKSEIYQGLNRQGKALIPCEDPQAAVLQSGLDRSACVYFGVDQGDVHAAGIHLKPLSSCFELVYAGNRVRIALPVPGRHMIHNAVAAAALALSAAVPASALTALDHFSNASGRLQQKRTAQGALLIDDTYNANPDAFKAAIDVLAAFPSPRILVMGAIGELGVNAPALHAEVGAYARERGIEAALFVGEHTQYAAQAFGQPDAYYADKNQLLQALRRKVELPATVLVKGSRFMKMETVVQALMTEPSCLCI